MADIDECDYDPNDDQDRLCAGLCRNTIGSYICIDEDEEEEEIDEPEVTSCPPGFNSPNINGQQHCQGSFHIQLSPKFSF